MILFHKWFRLDLLIMPFRIFIAHEIKAQLLVQYFLVILADIKTFAQVSQVRFFIVFVPFILSLWLSILDTCNCVKGYFIFLFTVSDLLPALVSSIF